MNLAIKIIEDSNVISSEDLQILIDLREELEDNFHTTQIFRTDTEMKMSVLNDIKHPTADSKYWQAQREQNVMTDQTVMASYEYRKNLVEIKKLERKLQTEEDVLERELLTIEIEKLKYISLRIARTAKDRIREIRQWHDIKETLKPHLKYGTKDVNAHQLESYHERFKLQARALPAMTGPEQNNLMGQLITTESILKDQNILKSIDHSKQLKGGS